MILRILVILATVVAASVSRSETVSLFELSAEGHAVPVAEYRSALKSLKAGDKVRFANGEEFVLGKYLGDGMTAKVFEIAGTETVIRIPSTNTPVEFGMQQIAGYLHGFSTLEKFEVPIPKVVGGRESEYLIVEKIPLPHMDLQDFLSSKNQMSAAARMKAEAALLEFAKQTAGLLWVKDAGYSQISYIESQNRWVLMDWQAEIHSAFAINEHGNVVRAAAPSLYAQKLKGSLLEDAIDWKGSLLSEHIRQVVEDERTRILKEDPDRARRFADIGISKFGDCASLFARFAAKL